MTTYYIPAADAPCWAVAGWRVRVLPRPHVSSRLFAEPKPTQESLL